MPGMNESIHPDPLCSSNLPPQDWGLQLSLWFMIMIMIMMINTWTSLSSIYQTKWIQKSLKQSPTLNIPTRWWFTFIGGLPIHLPIRNPHSDQVYIKYCSKPSSTTENITLYSFFLLFNIFLFANHIRKCLFGIRMMVEINYWFCKSMSFLLFKVACFLSSCFCSVLSHVILQITRPFAGVVALLACKGFLASVWEHVIL